MTLTEQQRQRLHRLIADELRAALSGEDRASLAATLAARRDALAADQRHVTDDPTHDPGGRLSDDGPGSTTSC
ncbi:hypothetical protein Q0Z83_045440 [Actinoplanes sichuanensis]|uniref:Uncharacterized protein n=1 Tax=Actinoplanes sichuanensis TaxID=512349 RepID=A0ABW4A9K7_9ACTN|nr:hypothetical protein [Actinoplanes sichuanensis]BEL06353.1 hypothetical protein Q0Z83_045440 [Actinoplanes sichuanensis]